MGQKGGPCLRGLFHDRPWEFRRQPRHCLSCARLHQSQEAPGSGPADHYRRRRHSRPGRQRQDLYRRPGRVVVHVFGILRGSPDRSRHPGPEEAPLLPRFRPQDRRRYHRAGGEADLHRPGADVEGVVRQFGLGSHRSGDQAGLVLQQRPRAGGKKEDHLPQPGLSRDYGRRRQPDGAVSHSRRFRPAHRALPAHGLSAFLPRGRRGRVGRGFRVALRREPGEVDRRGRPGHHRRLLRRAGHGGGRRHRAAGDLFRKNPGGAQKIRRVDAGRRSDLRLRAHRQHVGYADLWHEAGHDHLRQGAVVGLYPDCGADDFRTHLPGHGQGK